MKPMTILYDSSEVSLAAALLQNEQPVAFDSRTLTPMERGYAQIERECLTIVFANKIFNRYIYGRESVHIQVTTSLLKPSFAALKYLQDMLLGLWNFSWTYVTRKEQKCI